MITALGHPKRISTPIEENTSLSSIKYLCVSPCEKYIAACNSYSLCIYSNLRYRILLAYFARNASNYYFGVHNTLLWSPDSKYVFASTQPGRYLCVYRISDVSNGKTNGFNESEYEEHVGEENEETTRDTHFLSESKANMVNVNFFKAIKLPMEVQSICKTYDTLFLASSKRLCFLLINFNDLKTLKNVVYLSEFVAEEDLRKMLKEDGSEDNEKEGKFFNFEENCDKKGFKCNGKCDDRTEVHLYAPFTLADCIFKHLNKRINQNFTVGNKLLEENIESNQFNSSRAGNFSKEKIHAKPEEIENFSICCSEYAAATATSDSHESCMNSNSFMNSPLSADLCYSHASNNLSGEAGREEAEVLEPNSTFCSFPMFDSSSFYSNIVKNKGIRQITLNEPLDKVALVFVSGACIVLSLKYPFAPYFTHCFSSSSYTFILPSNNIVNECDILLSIQEDNTTTDHNCSSENVLFSSPSPSAFPSPVGILVRCCGVDSVEFNANRRLIALGLKDGTFDILSFLSFKSESSINFLTKVNVVDALSMNCTLRHFGKVEKMCWSRDGLAVAVGWLNEGFALFSYRGEILFSSFRSSEYSSNCCTHCTSSCRSCDSSNSSFCDCISAEGAQNLGGVISMSWTSYDLGVILCYKNSPNELTEFSILRSAALGVAPHPLDSAGSKSSHDYNARVLMSSDRFLVCSSALWSPYSTAWIHIPLPPSNYTSRNWPLKQAYLNLTREFLLTTGIRGVAIYKLKERRWIYFSRIEDELALQTSNLPVGWYSPYVFFVCCRNSENLKNSLSEYSSSAFHAERSLENHFLREARHVAAADYYSHDAEREQGWNHYKIYFFDVSKRLDINEAIAVYEHLASRPLRCCILQPSDSMNPLVGRSEIVQGGEARPFCASEANAVATGGKSSVTKGTFPALAVREEEFWGAAHECAAKKQTLCSFESNGIFRSNSSCSWSRRNSYENSYECNDGNFDVRNIRESEHRGSSAFPSIICPSPVLVIYDAKSRLTAYRLVFIRCLDKELHDNSRNELNCKIFVLWTANMRPCRWLEHPLEIRFAANQRHLLVLHFDGSLTAVKLKKKSFKQGKLSHAKHENSHQAAHSYADSEEVPERECQEIIYAYETPPLVRNVKQIFTGATANLKEFFPYPSALVFPKPSAQKDKPNESRNYSGKEIEMRGSEALSGSDLHQNSSEFDENKVRDDDLLCVSAVNVGRKDGHAETLFSAEAKNPKYANEPRAEENVTDSPYYSCVSSAAYSPLSLSTMLSDSSSSLKSTSNSYLHACCSSSSMSAGAFYANNHADRIRLTEYNSKISEKCLKGFCFNSNLNSIVVSDTSSNSNNTLSVFTSEAVLNTDHNSPHNNYSYHLNSAHAQLMQTKTQQTVLSAILTLDEGLEKNTLRALTSASSHLPLSSPSSTFSSSLTDEAKTEKVNNTSASSDTLSESIGGCVYSSTSSASVSSYMYAHKNECNRFCADSKTGFVANNNDMNRVTCYCSFKYLPEIIAEVPSFYQSNKGDSRKTNFSRVASNNSFIKNIENYGRKEDQSLIKSNCALPVKRTSCEDYNARLCTKSNNLVNAALTHDKNNFLSCVDADDEKIQRKDAEGKDISCEKFNHDGQKNSSNSFDCSSSKQVNNSKIDTSYTTQVENKDCIINHPEYMSSRNVTHDLFKNCDSFLENFEPKDENFEEVQQVAKVEKLQCERDEYTSNLLDNIDSIHAGYYVWCENTSGLVLLTITLNSENHTNCSYSKPFAKETIEFGNQKRKNNKKNQKLTFRYRQGFLLPIEQKPHPVHIIGVLAEVGVVIACSTVVTFNESKKYPSSLLKLQMQPCFYPFIRKLLCLNLVPFSFMNNCTENNEVGRTNELNCLTETVKNKNGLSRTKKNAENKGNLNLLKKGIDFAVRLCRHFESSPFFKHQMEMVLHEILFDAIPAYTSSLKGFKEKANFSNNNENYFDSLLSRCLRFCVTYPQVKDYEELRSVKRFFYECSKKNNGQTANYNDNEACEDFSLRSDQSEIDKDAKEPVEIIRGVGSNYLRKEHNSMLSINKCRYNNECYLSHCRAESLEKERGVKSTFEAKSKIISEGSNKACDKKVKAGGSENFGATKNRSALDLDALCSQEMSVNNNLNENNKSRENAEITSSSNFFPSCISPKKMNFSCYDMLLRRKDQKEFRILAAAIDLLKYFKVHLSEVLITCIRKTEPLITPFLVFPLSSLQPHDLFLDCLKKKSVRIASLFLIILQNIVGPLKVRQHYVLPLLYTALKCGYIYLTASILVFFKALYVLSPSKPLGDVDSFSNVIANRNNPEVYSSNTFTKNGDYHRGIHKNNYLNSGIAQEKIGSESKTPSLLDNINEKNALFNFSSTQYNSSSSTQRSFFSCRQYDSLKASSVMPLHKYSRKNSIPKVCQFASSSNLFHPKFKGKNDSLRMPELSKNCCSYSSKSVFDYFLKYSYDFSSATQSSFFSQQKCDLSLNPSAHLSRPHATTGNVKVSPHPGVAYDCDKINKLNALLVYTQHEKYLTETLIECVEQLQWIKLFYITSSLKLDLPAWLSSSCDYLSSIFLFFHSSNNTSYTKTNEEKSFHKYTNCEKEESQNLVILPLHTSTKEESKKISLEEIVISFECQFQTLGRKVSLRALNENVPFQNYKFSSNMFRSLPFFDQSYDYTDSDKFSNFTFFFNANEKEEKAKKHSDSQDVNYSFDNHDDEYYYDHERKGKKFVETFIYSDAILRYFIIAFLALRVHIICLGIALAAKSDEVVKALLFTFPDLRHDLVSALQKEELEEKAIETQTEKPKPFNPVFTSSFSCSYKKWIVKKLRKIIQESFP